MKQLLNIKKNKSKFSLAEKSVKLKGALDYILKNKCHYTLLGDYLDLPNSFSGNDIDILVTDIDVAEKAFRKYGFIFRQQHKFELRAFLYIDSVEKWVTVDIETIDSYPYKERIILKHILDNSIKDSKEGLLHPPIAGILAYKIIKYIFNGYVHSWHQIQSLNENWNKLKIHDQEAVLSLLQDFNLNQKVINIITSNRKGEGIDNPYLQEYINNKRKIRHIRRLIYQGRIKTKVLFIRPLLLWSLFYGRFFKSKNALPAIAIVGNDGSGKTEQCQRLKDELYKLDPLHIVMRGNEAWLPGWRVVRNFILSYIKKRKELEVKSNSSLIWLFSWVGEIGDFLDKWFRYQVGMAWANSGFGFVMFERYPTDRLRGEYPGPKWSLFPVEQYFPMPDLVVLLDVKEEDSLRRKPNDGHFYQEMHEKRENYLRLIKEIKPSIVINSKTSLNDAQKQLSKLIWNYSIVKQQSGGVPVNLLAKWTPENNNKSPGRDKQKEGFL
jgi:hypothetical protein